MTIINNIFGKEVYSLESPTAEVNWRRCLLAVAEGTGVDADLDGDEGMRR